MFRSLLVPLDGTTFSEHALPVAELIAGRAGAVIHLARVHVPHPPDGLISNTQFQFEGVDLDEYETGTRSDEQRYLEHVIERMKKDTDLEVDGSLLQGDVAGRLEEHARATEADLVVMATHGRAGLPRVWLGSVAEELICCTTVPVLVVHALLEYGVADAPQAVKRILVPLDGSALAEAILTPAMDLAATMNAHLTLVRVAKPGALRPSARRDAIDYLQRVRKNLSDLQIAADTVVVTESNTADAICAVARESAADLIALATHGRSGLSRALLGSVTHEVLHHTTLPVLVRRPALA